MVEPEAVIRPVEGMADVRALSEVLSAVWGNAGDDPVIPLNVLQALHHAGNYLVVVTVNGTTVGASVAWLGIESGELLLHSHITATLPEARSRGLGFRLKQHQRAWALERDIATIHWTFDPLVRRNAYFNLSKLGAEASAYYRDFYGEMHDAINGEDESDRILVSWPLRHERVELAAKGVHVEPSVEGAEVLLDVSGEGSPLVRQMPDTPIVLCRTPDDIVALRVVDAARAHEWRVALRDTLGEAMDGGLVLTAVTRDGSYVLERHG